MKSKIFCESWSFILASASPWWTYNCCSGALLRELSTAILVGGESLKSQIYRIVIACLFYVNVSFYRRNYNGEWRDKLPLICNLNKVTANSIIKSLHHFLNKDNCHDICHLSNPSLLRIPLMLESLFAPLMHLSNEGIHNKGFVFWCYKT